MFICKGLSKCIYTGAAYEQKDPEAVRWVRGKWYEVHVKLAPINQNNYDCLKKAHLNRFKVKYNRLPQKVFKIAERGGSSYAMFATRLE